MLLQTDKEDDEYWPSISDLMSGLMVIFLLIAVAYMHNVAQGQQKIRKIAVTYHEAQIALYDRLTEEFKDDLPKWKAVIDKETLAVRFFEPDILFQTGESHVTPRFQAILSDFFPRYLRIIFSDEFKNHVSEVRIEGHTSSEWSTSSTTTEDAYFLNMQLSQARTIEVLKCCYTLHGVESYREDMRRLVTANGLSSSKPILLSNGQEDKKLSRRVEFRTRTNADSKIVQIIGELGDD